MQKARGRTLTLRPIVLPRLVDIRFQNLFTPLAGVLFTFPSRYWFTIGHQVVFSLGRWSSQIPTGFQVSTTSRLGFVYGAITRFGQPFQVVQLPAQYPLSSLPIRLVDPTTRYVQRRQACIRNVWALPRSLATTRGISIDFFS